MALFFAIFTSLSHAQEQSWSLRTLNQLNLQEKIGQLLVPAIIFSKFKDSVLLEDEMIEHIRTNHIGGCILLGCSEPQAYANLLQRLQHANKSSSNIPLLNVLDAEWGASMRINGLEEIRMPFNLTLGAIGDNALIYQAGKEVGRQLAILGVHLNCAPVVDVNFNAHNPIINRRSFGQDPHNVALKGCAFMHGLQDAGIIACAKHFPGHGDTRTDSHVALPVIPHTIERLNKIELVPFTSIINDGAMAIMSGHLLVSALDDKHTASTSHTILSDMLRNKYRFNGLIVTDGLDMHGILSRYSPAQAACKALRAGNDILLIPSDIPGTIKAIEELINNGKLTIEELDQHVLRILQAKEWLMSQIKTNYLHDVIPALITEEAKNVSRTLYAHAITTVKDDNKLLPLSANNKVAIVICGTEEQTIFAKKMHTHADIIYLNTDTNIDIKPYDTIIFALYGIQYRPLPLYGIDASSLTYINEIAQKHTNVALVLFGNPYALQYFEHIPTVVVAYEEHQYAQEAAADIILGNKKAVGRLPITAGCFHAGSSLSLVNA